MFTAVYGCSEIAYLGQFLILAVRQLFTWVTVKSLSTTVASDDQPATFRCGEGVPSRKPGFRIRASRKLASGIRGSQNLRYGLQKQPAQVDRRRT